MHVCNLEPLVASYLVLPSDPVVTAHDQRCQVRVQSAHLALQIGS